MPTNIANMKIGDRVVVYNNAGHPPLDGVPTYAESLEGVGFTGHRWVSAANRLKDLPADWYPAVLSRSTVEVLQQHAPLVVLDVRSEERRVGKGCRYRWRRNQSRKRRTTR